MSDASVTLLRLAALERLLAEIGNRFMCANAVHETLIEHRPD